ncbi:MAG: hypothetical protein JXB32_11890 [Deltaproteobacteria bacterium]|nr:hypothetical protein [Deltaproteobacteria bacterium]
MRRWAPWFALAAVQALHVVLVLYFQPPEVILSGHPVGGFDWETHYEQTARAVQAYRESGETWSYNPHRLAGQPSGVIFDADNKGWELWTIALTELGVPLPTAFNLFVWLSALFVPLAFFLAGRWFGLGAVAAAAAAGLASACWAFDALAHLVSWVGMTCWGFAAWLWIPALALFWRWLETRRPWRLFVLFVLLVVLHNLHPYSFFLLAVPMGWLYVREFRTLRGHEHAALVAVAVGTIVTNLWWLEPSLRFWHYILDSGFYLDATPDYLLTDYLGLGNEPAVTGVIAMRTGFRFLALGGAVLALWLWRRDGDRRFAPFAASLGALLFVAYLGGWFGPLRQVQPYRFVLPAMYLAVIPAAWFLERGLRSLRELRPTPVVWALLGLGLFVAVPRLARDVLYFVPDAIPRQTRPLPAPPPDVNGGIYFGTIRWPEPFDFRLHPRAAADFRDVAAFVSAADDGQGRWLVEWWMLGEHLTWNTDAQILGGFLEINLAHSDANLFRRYAGKAPPTDEELRAYLEQYNVRWVILSNPIPRLESRTDLLQLVTTIFRQRVYRVRDPSHFIVGGGPGEVRARLNRIAVRGSAGGNLVLRYHWMETLRCRPDCSVRRVTVPGDRVGFVGVEHAPPDFEIYNSYD